MRGLLSGSAWGVLLGGVAVVGVSLVGETPAGNTPPVAPLVTAPETANQTAPLSDIPETVPAEVETAVIAIAPRVAAPQSGQAPLIADTSPAALPATGAAITTPQAPAQGNAPAITATAEEPVLPNPQSVAPQVPVVEDDLVVSTAPAAQPEPVPDPVTEPEIVVVDVPAVAEGVAPQADAIIDPIAPEPDTVQPDTVEPDTVAVAPDIAAAPQTPDAPTPSENDEIIVAAVDAPQADTSDAPTIEAPAAPDTPVTAENPPAPETAPESVAETAPETVAEITSETVAEAVVESAVESGPEQTDTVAQVDTPQTAEVIPEATPQDVAPDDGPDDNTDGNTDGGTAPATNTDVNTDLNTDTDTAGDTAPDAPSDAPADAVVVLVPETSQSLPTGDSSVTIRRPATDTTTEEVAITAEPVTQAGDGTPAIVRYGMPSANPDNKPTVAVVMIDDGSFAGAVPAMAGIPFPITVILNPSAPDVAEKMLAYRAAGIEVGVLADLPTGATPADIEVFFEAAFAALPETVAVLDVGGTISASGNAVISQAISAVGQDGRGLVTVSRGLNTTLREADRAGVPTGIVYRDLDSEGQDARVIRRFMDQAAFRARQESGVVLLGRIRADTISALILWGTANRAGQVALVPITSVFTDG